MVSDLRTCLWFRGDGMEAAELYVTLLPDSRIEKVVRDDGGAAYVMVHLILAGVPYMLLSVPPQEGMPGFELSPAVSISVLTRDQAETDRLWERLLADGGEESMCGWLTDRFGLSWQIIPEVLMRMVESEDRAAAHRAQAAMYTMRRIDIAALEAAFANTQEAET